MWQKELFEKAYLTVFLIIA